MKKHTIILFLLVILVDSSLFSQLMFMPDTLDIPQVVVTANRNSRNLEDIPGRVTIIDSKTISEMPVQNVDGLLRSVANIYVNRSWGIFSQNSSVTMRGLDASSRVLVLVDGVPLNKSAGGSVNWHLIPKDDIERIEIIKGPASAIYGNNAMGGVINIITKKADSKIQGQGSLQVGTYNTFGAYVNASGTSVQDDKGFYWGVSSFYRQGDGYYLNPEEIRDSTDAKAFLTELNASGNVGYAFNSNQKVELSARYYNDLRGQGRQVYEDYGDYVALSTTFLRANYQGVFNKTIVNAQAFYQLEYETKQSESVSSNSGKYKLSVREGRKDDIGLWINATTHFSERNILTYGVDIKQGSASVETIYKTSTDELTYEGMLDFYGLFIQDEFKFMDEKFILVAGARMDFSKYHKGSLNVLNPTTNTGFTESFYEEFDENSWNAFSPKLALKYRLTKNHSLYISYSQGFMPPKLDDLSKSGKIRKGFKIANPELGPEYLTNYELGATLHLLEKITIEPSVYYSLGKDFQYFVGTGDSIDTGSDELKPVYQRQNISDVEIIGAEISTTYKPMASLTISANYTYNHSTIKEFKGATEEKDLTGKYLIEVPKHMAYFGATWNNKFFNATLAYNYISSQWYDDENTILISDYQTVDVQISREFFESLNISLDIQNILDNEYVDRKGYLSPGRFIILEAAYKF